MESTRQPVQLPTTKLTIPAPSSHSHTTTSSSNYRPSSLKIRITPHLLLPSPPFAPGASGKKIEDCVDVIVAVGGKVDVGIEVEEDGLEWAEGLGDVEEVIKTRVEGLFQANLDTLALSSASSPALEIPLSPLQESQPESSSRLAFLRLSPLISNPSHSNTLKTLTTTGRPQAVLSRIDIKLEWAPSRRENKADNEEDTQLLEEGEDDQGGDSQESGEGGEESQHIWDEDEFCDMPSEDDIMMEDVMDMIGNDGGEGEEGRMGGVGLPKWVESQLRNGIYKVMRTHMIRRFPLIFDSALIKNATSLALHRSLTASLTAFMKLSTTHSTSFLHPAQDLFRSISAEQETFLNLNVNAASLIRGTVIPKASGPATGRRAKRRKTATGEAEVEDEIPDPQSATGRAKIYMDQVHLKVIEEDDGPKADERRVGRLIGEAMGRLGRGKWEAGRKGTGRMAAFRVPLKDTCTSLTEADPLQDPAVHEEEDLNPAAQSIEDDLYDNAIPSEFADDFDFDLNPAEEQRFLDDWDNDQEPMNNISSPEFLTDFASPETMEIMAELDDMEDRYMDDFDIGSGAFEGSSMICEDDELFDHDNLAL